MKGSASPCGATMESKAVPGHTHVCVGGHGLGDHHKCGDQECLRWFNPGPVTVGTDVLHKVESSTKLKLRKKTDPPRWAK